MNKRFINRAKNIIINFCSKTKMGRMFLFYFSETFNQEFKESLIAKKIFNDQNNNNKNIFLLRRNIHRIEKGLIIKNRRPIFALGYIKPTVDNFVELMSNKLLLEKYEDDLNWAKQVLNKYFSVVEINDFLKKLKLSFDNVVTNSSDICSNLLPYEFDEISNMPLINFEQFQSLVKRRRSVRIYKNKTVNNSIIEKALELAKYSPSPCNRYSVRYHCVSDRVLITKLGTTVGGAKSFIDNVPLLIAITSIGSAFQGLYDRHATYIDASLSLMTFIYSLETMGLSTCVINWPKVPKNDRLAKKYIDLVESENIIMLLSVGYAHEKGMIPYSQKMNNKNLIKYYE